MTTVIKGGTIVTHDRTYKADVLVEGGVITAIGQNLVGDTLIEAEGAYVMPGGIDPHTHLEMPFMGTSTAETWESGTFAAASGGTTSSITSFPTQPTYSVPWVCGKKERPVRPASTTAFTCR